MIDDRDRQARNKRYHQDPRIIAARKQYRSDLKAGVPEKSAWAKASLVYAQVRQEVGL